MSEPGDNETPAGSSEQGEGILGNLSPRSEAVTKAVEKRKEAMNKGELVESPEEQKIRHLEKAKATRSEFKQQTDSQTQTETSTETLEKNASQQTPEATKVPEQKARYEPRDVFIYEPHSKTTGSLTRVSRVTGRSVSGEPHFDQLTVPLSELELGKKIAIEVELPLGSAYYAPHEGTSLDERIVEANLKRSGLPHTNKPLFVKHIPGEKADVETKGYKIISAKERVEEQKLELPKAA